MLASNGDDLTETDDEMAKAFRQMAFVFAELEKQRLVNKLRKAQDRKRAENGKCEGRPGPANSGQVTPNQSRVTP